jgi:hypothetical protein
MHLRDRGAATGCRHEQCDYGLGEAERASQQYGSVLAGSAVDAPFQVTD